MRVVPRSKSFAKMMRKRSQDDERAEYDEEVREIREAIKAAMMPRKRRKRKDDDKIDLPPATRG